MERAATAFSSPSFLRPFHKLPPNPRNTSFLQPSFHFSPTSQRPSFVANPATRSDHRKIKVVLGEDGKEISEGFYDSEEELDEEEEESSIDLLFRFLQTVLRKMSKQVKKATRSVLPPPISPQLVSFAVDGVLLLTVASIAKALLEVVCNLGGTVFVVILFLRLIWGGVSHFQSSDNSFDDNGTYNTTQHVT